MLLFREAGKQTKARPHMAYVTVSRATTFARNIKDGFENLILTHQLQKIDFDIPINTKSLINNEYEYLRSITNVFYDDVTDILLSDL